ncbi:hypothetical protein Isop_0912 [Isosphaera pallida ATCC 43644]|uniref:Cytochrome c domain-containing protein n=1 Tax=Isosphaera pallida (strain ATCC 43644 / DSM 9630 / IS1B) TaxID=575540 RepID=E8R2Z7_ISOPI|nr:c-type cytochrome [Isosphaera pallida]ADV61501.1 hypothetical protein Isop_0912 [Isosphaera pallida ATCC 43644]
MVLRRRSRDKGSLAAVMVVLLGIGGVGLTLGGDHPWNDAVRAMPPDPSGNTAKPDDAVSSFGPTPPGWVDQGPAARPYDPDAAARGRAALVGRSFLSPVWSESAYKRVVELWNDRLDSEPSPPDPERDPQAYAQAFQHRYGLHPAPFPNDGLPMGIRKAVSHRTGKTGLMIDCMICHGGSLNGQGYVGLGNTQLDLTGFFTEFHAIEGRGKLIFPFTLNTVRGAVNAGQIAAFLIALRNPDLSLRLFPLPLKADLPEMDVPAWWLLKKKKTMYCDGRTDAESVRTNMQFLMGELRPEQFRELEPVFADIRQFFLSLKPPAYPFPIDRDLAERGRVLFEGRCSKCHGTYGPHPTYPNVVVELERIGTDPVRAQGLSRGLVAHYNSTWFGEHHPGDLDMIGYQAPPLDGIWATAPYFHNGAVPTLYDVLNSPTRPTLYRRPPSTDFLYYDQTKVGWKVEPISRDELQAETNPRRARFVFDSTRKGLSVGGHTFGDSLTEEQRAAIIEYLKTL